MCLSKDPPSFTRRCVPVNYFLTFEVPIEGDSGVDLLLLPSLLLYLLFGN